MDSIFSGRWGGWTKHYRNSSALWIWILAALGVFTDRYSPLAVFTGAFFSLAGFGSTQFNRTAGSFVAPGNRGQVRIYSISGTDVHVQLYAFNPSVNNYLFFAPQRANGGSGNSW